MINDMRGAAKLLLWMGIPLWQEPDPNILTIAGLPETTAYQNSAYTFSVTATGGSGGYTYSLIGLWPSGITVDTSTGVVSGTPTVPGDYPDLIVRVTDSNGAVDDLDAFSITVVKLLTVAFTPVTPVKMGDNYVATAVADGGLLSYAYSLLGSWPPGIVIDGATGVLSGEITDVGTFTGLSIRVEDGAGHIATTSTFSIVVDPATAGFRLIGVSAPSTGNPATPTYTEKDLPVLLVTAGGSRSTHGGVAPYADAGWTKWADFCGGTDRSMAVYYRVVTGMAPVTVTWTNATTIRAMWAYCDAEIDAIEFSDSASSVNLQYPQL